jgi:hypothetical protein
MKNLKNHECVINFEVEKVDYCDGEAYDRCSGINPMILELYFRDQDGTEFHCDGWVAREVKYCPFCGLKSE